MVDGEDYSAGAANAADTPPAADAHAVPLRDRYGLTWERTVRCLLLAAVLAAIAFLTYRPAILRFSRLMFAVSPSRGDSLAWRPDDDLLPTPSAAMPLEAVTPDEWRPDTPPAARRPGERIRSGTDDGQNWRGGDPLPPAWRRLSGNPWRWRDDASPPPPARGDSGLPAQKPASSFRTGRLEGWDRRAGSNAERLVDADRQDRAPEAQGPAIPDPPAPEDSMVASATEVPASLRPPSAAPGLPPPAQETPPAEDMDWTTFVVPPASAAPATTATMDKDVALSAAGTPDEAVDWLNREIAAPIPGAYLTIYPHLRFIGLCVPGQGYIRKYNQVAAPADLAGDKVAAADGRTPYGKYYIAARSREDNGARLVLSWPSPDDARRLGLDAGTVQVIEEAWAAQTLPPQDTVAGGGIALSALADGQETTDGGFALEPPQLEELATALADGAWVFIQE